MVEGNELAAFIRARREHLTPAEVGLPSGGRRRTPGLRREELATLAGISIDYLIRLEQGKDKHPSAAVVSALAKALHLSEPERQHLAFLAAISSSSELCPERGALPKELRPSIRELVDQLEPVPAFVLDPLNDVLLCNSAWAGLTDHTELFEESNLVRFVFLGDLADDLFPDWPAAADEQVAQLRAAQPRWGTDPAFTALLDELSESEEFVERWDAHPVGAKRPTTKALQHPVHGTLLVDVEVLTLADDELRIVTWHAADAHTAEVFEARDQPELVSPAKLRVVGSGR